MTPAFPQFPAQRGMASAAQLLSVGFTRSAIRRARGRRWRELQPGVYVPHLGPVEPADRMVAAALWAGPGSVLTGLGALHLWGVYPHVPTEHVFLVGDNRQGRRRPGVRCVRTRRHPEPASIRWCVAIASPGRALVDAAIYRSLGQGAIRSLTISLLQRRLVTPGDLRREVAGACRPGAAPVRRGLAEFEAGAWSVPEARLRELVAADPRLPAMVSNKVVERLDGTPIGIPDGFFERAGVVVQVHSRQHHADGPLGPDRWSDTVESDQRYTAAGLLVLAVTPRTLTRRPQQFLDRLAGAIALRGGWTPTARVAQPR